MKRSQFLALSLAAVMSLLACRKSKPAPPPPAPAGAVEATAATGAPTPVDVQKLPDAPQKEVDLSAITTALRNYVADRQINPKLVTDLSVLVPKYLPQLPPPPAGQKYIWNNLLVVSLAKK